MNPSAEGQPTTSQPATTGAVKQHIVSNPFPTETASHNVETPAIPSPAAPPATDSPVVRSATPPLAADNDLIEKDWVNLVEKTIDELSGDPYQLQARQAALSQDYLKKRFNIDVGQG